jgi:hypothetical protein
VQQQQILRRPFGEEVLDRHPDALSGLVAYDRDLEAADSRIAEHLGQGLGVARR